jgi:hypothetical protein
MKIVNLQNFAALLRNSHVTLVCRDTQFENHCSKPLIRPSAAAKDITYDRPLNEFIFF